MKAARPIPRVPVKVTGESLASYVDRLAAMHHVDLVVTFHTLGIISEEQYEVISGYGVFLTDRQQEQFAVAARMSVEQVASMLLSAYDGIALDLSGARPGDSHGLRQCAQDQWAYFSGSHVCPQCIEENDGAWQLAWKLPWTFVCRKHKCYLVSHCPECERRFHAGRRDRSLSPVFVRKIPKIGVCNNPKPFGESLAGKGATPCGAVITKIVPTTAGVLALNKQAHIDAALSGADQAVLGEPVSPLEFFHDLRSLCALILYCAKLEDLKEISKVEKAAFTAFAEKRDAIMEERKLAAAPRNSNRVRVFIGPQENPALMSAVIGHALEILRAPDQLTMMNCLKPFAERSTVRAPTARWEIMKNFRFSHRISPAFHLCLAEKATFDRSVGNRSLLASENRYEFDVRHVPQLLWTFDYEAYFSDCFPKVGNAYARRFCAMSLAKLSGEHTWGDVAKLLGLPVCQAIKLANRCVGVLAEEKTKQRFARDLHNMGKRLSQRSDKIDYSRRREAFCGLTDIPHSDWLEICREAGISLGKPGRRSKYAATWLWSYLTDGDWTLAPALAGENLTNTREVYRSMLKSVLVTCRPALVNYGYSLLAKEKL